MSRLHPVSQCSLLTNVKNILSEIVFFCKHPLLRNNRYYLLTYTRVPSLVPPPPNTQPALPLRSAQ